MTVKFGVQKTQKLPNLKQNSPVQINSYNL